MIGLMKETAKVITEAGYTVRSRGFICPAGTYVAVSKDGSYFVAFVGPDKVLSVSVDGMHWPNVSAARDVAAAYASHRDHIYPFTLPDEGLTDLPLKGTYDEELTDD